VNVLVAGGTGFIGGAIARRLRSEGADVTIASRASGIDLTDPNAVARLGRFAVIVHAAGAVPGPAARAAPSAMYRDYQAITRHLLDLARTDGARVVLASSYVYGISPHVPASEDHEAQAHSPYSASRLAAEAICREYHRDFGVAVDVLRIFNAYGPGQPDTFVVPAIVSGAVRGRIALADPAPRRDFVHVDDVARAFALASRRTAIGFEVFNIGSGESRSVDEVARTAARLAGGAVEIVYSGANRALEICDARADIAKAARMLAWRPAIDFESGLAALVAAAGDAGR
jgi:nucleoside-diphosphate-sugar epimerase